MSGECERGDRDGVVEDGFEEVGETLGIENVRRLADRVERPPAALLVHGAFVVELVAGVDGDVGDADEVVALDLAHGLAVHGGDLLAAPDPGAERDAFDAGFFPEFAEGGLFPGFAWVDTATGSDPVVTEDGIGGVGWFLVLMMEEEEFLSLVEDDEASGFADGKGRHEAGTPGRAMDVSDWGQGRSLSGCGSCSMPARP
jgi:hypothetical protein